MKKLIPILTALALSATVALAQPKVKSKKEGEAIQAVFAAATPDARIAAVDALLLNFADTEFKAIALQVAAASAQEKNDFEKMVIYAERTLEADPKNFSAMLMLGSGYAQRTREHDLDKEDKLKTAEKYSNGAIELLKTAAKPRPDITDEQWEGAKKDFMAQAHEALGMVASTRKKNPEAIEHYKTAIATAATPDVVTKVRLAAAYNANSNWDDALKLLEEVMADANLNPAVRQFAGQEKLKAAMGKAKK